MSQVLGICVGAVTLSVAEGEGEKTAFHRIPHDGKVAQALESFLKGSNGARIGVTGQKFRRTVPYPSVAEPQAVEMAYRHIRDKYPGIDTIVSAGGESFLAYSLDASGSVRAIHTGNKCAAGTGEFFLQQVRRMGLSVDEAVALADSEDPYRVASRCSVFCKSDCTHALNKGVERGRIAAGLCRMLSAKITELLKAARARRVLLIGGVSRNPVVVRYLKESYPETFVPEEADCFEALGALLWVRNNGTGTFTVSPDNGSSGSYPILPPLDKGISRVTFLDGCRGEYHGGDYVLGLDVGSTTTKAVLIRTDEKSMVCDVYLRTDGDPIGASRACYRALAGKLPEGFTPSIVALGVTGSGRQIAGLHALSDTVFNEILAHGRAAAHFDPGVDTIFEIGGQDAKYTLLAQGVPVDYAMNEACSAGTGSFLEEAARESLGLTTEEIAFMALRGERPPDFSDQCSAFIGSDIKTAIQEGMEREDIAAGLVYSVCRNYLNRVRSSRRTGEKIFMQGGVCYNKAVPLAMANLCGRDIVVPPEPGLMGAFGAALMALQKLEEGATDRGSWDLLELSRRQAQSLEPFVCTGGREECDRKCSISRYRIQERVYPFGGSCDRYYNRRNDRKEVRGRRGDLVRWREEILAVSGGMESSPGGLNTVGIPLSLMSNTFYPLYEGFFRRLGMKVVSGGEADPGGMDEAGAALCYPLLQSHGFLKDLLRRGVDYVFIPHVKRLSSGNDGGDMDSGCTCPLVQAEPYILRAAFHGELKSRLVTEVLDLSGRRQAREGFIRIGKVMGLKSRTSVKAFEGAWGDFSARRERLLDTGTGFVRDLEPGERALVLFGRPYNAFTRQGNMGIPGKFTSRGYRIVPHDMLAGNWKASEEDEPVYWSSGRTILSAARMVRETPGLFGVFITNFSCGPDSFIIEKFRFIMEGKPYLVLELDAHTADAGVDTRIEAFLEIVRSSNGSGPLPRSGSATKPRVVTDGGRLTVRTGGNGTIPVTDPRVHVLVPSMGDLSSRGMEAALRHSGIKASAVPPPGREELETGKQHASCKECLPYLLTSGSLQRLVRERPDPDEILLYFMPGAEGPCRFGLYGNALEKQVEREGLENVGVLSLTCDNGYEGLPGDLARRALLAVSITDGLTDLRAGVLTLARDRERAFETLKCVEDRALEALASRKEREVLDVLRRGMEDLARLERLGTTGEVTKVLLTGEIFVRKDSFSSCGLVSRLADQGVLVLTSPIMEWILYVDYTVFRGLMEEETSAWDRLTLFLRNRYSSSVVRKVQEILPLSGFYGGHHPDISRLVDRGKNLIDPRLTGEAILTISSTLSEIGESVHGVISVSPFGCMPGRIAESIIVKRLEEDKPIFAGKRAAFWSGNRGKLPLPFLALETDGNPLSPMVETKLDSFVVSAHRLNKELKDLSSKSG